MTDKQEFIDVLETVYRGARKGRGLVVSPKGAHSRCAGAPALLGRRLMRPAVQTTRPSTGAPSALPAVHCLPGVWAS